MLLAEARKQVPNGVALVQEARGQVATAGLLVHEARQQLAAATRPIQLVQIACVALVLACLLSAAASIKRLFVK